MKLTGDSCIAMVARRGPGQCENQFGSRDRLAWGTARDLECVTNCRTAAGAGRGQKTGIMIAWRRGNKWHAGCKCAAVAVPSFSFQAVSSGTHCRKACLVLCTRSHGSMFCAPTPTGRPSTHLLSNTLYCLIRIYLWTLGLLQSFAIKFVFAPTQ